MSTSLKEKFPKRLGGTLHDWIEVKWCTHGAETVSAVVGRIVGDIAWDGGLPFHTSILVNLDRDAKQVETLNSVYSLGDEASKEDRQDFINYYRSTLYIPTQDWERTPVESA